jgi:hypothetical protein
MAISIQQQQMTQQQLGLHMQTVLTESLVTSEVHLEFLKQAFHLSSVIITVRQQF